jgi:hypothetical protein
VIENFLRPPHSFLGVTADGLRLLGLLSIGIAAFWFSPTDVGILAFALPALVAGRFLGVPSGFDVIFCVTVLVAAWSNVVDLYRTVPGWDVVIHLVFTAVLAPMVYLLLAQVKVLPRLDEATLQRRTVIVQFFSLGLALSALWEMVEWIGFVWITDDIYVEYHDTIGDMAVGGLGALVAGVVVAVRMSRTRAQVDTAAKSSLR